MFIYENYILGLGRIQWSFLSNILNPKFLRIYCVRFLFDLSSENTLLKRDLLRRDENADFEKSAKKHVHSIIIFYLILK